MKMNSQISFLVSSSGFKREIGLFLRNARLSTQLSQGQVATMLGLSSPQFISNIERGMTATPLHTLQRLVQIYRLDPNEVVDAIARLQKREFAVALSEQKKYLRAYLKAASVK